MLRHRGRGDVEQRGDGGDAAQGAQLAKDLQLVHFHRLTVTVKHLLKQYSRKSILFFMVW